MIENEVDRTVTTGLLTGRLEGNELAEPSFILGLVAAVALVIPFALFASPIAGLAAIGRGMPALARAERLGGSGKAIAGISLGSVAVAVSLLILFLLRHVLWRLFVESGAW
jgi:hypothetical protein